VKLVIVPKSELTEEQSRYLQERLDASEQSIRKTALLENVWVDFKVNRAGSRASPRFRGFGQG